MMEYTRILGKRKNGSAFTITLTHAFSKERAQKYIDSISKKDPYTDYSLGETSMDPSATDSHPRFERGTV